MRCEHWVHTPVFKHVLGRENRTKVNFHFT
jgi:hypothetical protein